MFNFFANHVVLEGDYNLADIRVEEEIGRGNAHVYTAYIKDHLYAIKQIQIKTDYAYQNFLKEVTFMKELSHSSKWFVKYSGYLLTKMELNQYDKKKYAFIVMECAEQNLQQFLSNRKDFSYRLRPHQIEVILQQILDALSSLQDQQIAHCDIKPENILIMNSHKLSIKLCDVGSCKIVSGQSLQEATILGTVPFLAPQLIRMKNKKMVTTNPFKSDVFSFGLVILYMLTLKKFKSHERLEIEEKPYKEIIHQWIKQAKELTDYDPLFCQILRNSLEFDEFRRPMFRDLKFMFFNEIKKRSIMNETFRSKLEKIQKEEQNRLMKMQQTSYFQSVPSNQLNFFKNRKVEHKLSFTKTISNNSFKSTTGNSFKISNVKGRNNSPSPVKRTISCTSSTSPEKERSLASICLSQQKKIILVSQQTKFMLSMIQEEMFNEADKNYILTIPFVSFRKAESVTVMPSCTFDVFGMLSDVQCKRLFIESIDKECLGLTKDNPPLNFSKIRANFTRCSLIGGFQGIFHMIVNSNLELLEIRLTQSEATFKEVLYLLDRLLSQTNIQTFLFEWQRRLFTEEEHIILTEKISKLPLKKLTMVMSQNYIKYEEGSRWPFPKNCEILSLNYSNNLLNNVVDNLSIGMATLSTLKQLYLNLQNNNLTKGQIHMLIKSTSSIKALERVSLNFAYNKIDELKYLESVLLEMLNINFLEIKLHRTDIQLRKVYQLIQNLKELFEFNLKIMKITCNRNMPLKIFKEIIQEECINKSLNKSTILRCDVVGYDNNCFMIYLKKKDKGHTNRIKMGSSTKKAKTQLLKKLPSISERISMSNYNSASKTQSICSQLYTLTQSYNNYLCITCCESQEISKSTFYCKFCLNHCFHKEKKDHYFVKANQATKCLCSYSGHCRSDPGPVICSDKMGVAIKKEFKCYKCLLSYCIVCIQNCKQIHRDWVKENKQVTIFKCKSKFT